MGMISTRLADHEVERLDALVKSEGYHSRSDAIRALVSANTSAVGCSWMAYYDDFSSIVPFGDEVSALRYAVAHQMQVIRVPHGIPVEEAVRARLDETRRR